MLGGLGSQLSFGGAGCFGRWGVAPGDGGRGGGLCSAGLALRKSAAWAADFAQRQPYGAFAKPPAPAAWISAEVVEIAEVVWGRFYRDFMEIL